MRIIDVSTFVNSFKVKPNKSMSFLFGSREHQYHPIYHLEDKWYGILREVCIVLHIT